VLNAASVSFQRDVRANRLVPCPRKKITAASATLALGDDRRLDHGRDSRSALYVSGVVDPPDAQMLPPASRANGTCASIRPLDPIHKPMRSQADLSGKRFAACVAEGLDRAAREGNSARPWCFCKTAVLLQDRGCLPSSYQTSKHVKAKGGSQRGPQAGSWLDQTEECRRPRRRHLPWAYWSCCVGRRMSGERLFGLARAEGPF